MVTEKVNIGFYRVGDTFSVKLTTLRNICNFLVSSIQVAVTIPDGLVLQSYTIPKGSYDTGDNIWDVGGMYSNQYLEAEFTFEVTDDCLSPFIIEFHTSSVDTCDECFNEPDYCFNVFGVSCCQILSCLPD